MPHCRFSVPLVLCLAVSTILAPCAFMRDACAQQATLNPPAANGQVLQQDTVAMVAVSSYDTLISDINYLGGLAGRPEVGQMLESIVVLFTQGKGLAGLDKTKPWGVLVKTDGVDFKPIGCLPISNAADLPGILAAFEIRVADLGDGLQEIEIPDNPSIYVKSVGSWAFVSSKVDFLTDLPANPEDELKALTDTYDISVRADIQKIPAKYREEAVNQLRDGLEEGLQRQDNEDDEEYQLRRRWAEQQMDGLVRLIQEMDQLTIGWEIDADSGQMYLDFTTTVVPGSNLSKQIASISANGKTNYAGFIQPDAAISGIFVSKTNPTLIQDDITQMKSMLDTAREQIAKEIDEGDDDLPASPEAREKVKQAVDDFIDAFIATVETGHMEGGAVLNMSPYSLTFVAGGHVTDPSKIESGIRKLASVAEEEPDFPGINWNADSYSGVSFHTAQVPIEADDEEARQLFGEIMDVSMGVGEDSIYFALGRDNLATTKAIMDASKSEPNKKVPVAQWSVALSPIMEVAAAFADDDDQQEREILEMMASTLKENAAGDDHILVTSENFPNGQRNRILVEKGVLKALGKAGEAASQAAAAGGGF